MKVSLAHALSRCVEGLHHTIADIKHILRSGKFVQKGDLVVNVASMPIADQGMANMLKLSAA